MSSFLSTWVSGVFKRVLRKQRTGKLDPEQKPSLQFPVTQKHVLSMPGLKHSTSQTLPRLCNQEETATKRVQRISPWSFVFWWCQHLQTVFRKLFVVWRIGDIVRRLLFIWVYMLLYMFCIYMHIHVICDFSSTVISIRSRLDERWTVCGLSGIDNFSVARLLILPHRLVVC